MSVRTPDLTKRESAVAELDRRIDAILLKESRLTRAQAAQFIFQRDRALYDRWRAETSA